MRSISINLIVAAVFLMQSFSHAQIPPHIEQWQPNVCRVDAKVDRTGGAGTGAYIGNGYVLTAYHVVEDYHRAFSTSNKRLTVEFYDQGKYKAELKWWNPDIDVAFLLISPPTEPNIKGVLLASEDPKQGDTAWKCGFGPDDRLIWHKCTVTQMSQNMKGDRCWFGMSPWSRSGDSGGPVFNADGELLGNLWGSLPEDNATTAVKPSAIATKFGSRFRTELVNYHVQCYGQDCYQQSPFIWGGQRPKYQQPQHQQDDPRLRQPAPGGILAKPNPQVNPQTSPPQTDPVNPHADLGPLQKGIAKLQDQIEKFKNRGNDSKLQNQLDSIGSENKSIRDRLDGLSGRLKELPEKLGGKISGTIGGFAESVPQESGFDWTGVLANVGIAALGVAGVGLPAWAIWAWRGYKVVRSVRKRRRQRKSRRQPPPVPSQQYSQQSEFDQDDQAQVDPARRETIIIDSPPLPPQRTIETRMVEVPVDRYEVAHEWARGEMFRKYPGSNGVLEVEKKLIKQALAADQN